MCVEYKAAGDGASALSDVFEEAGIDRQSFIQITGPDALISLLWLCRHGFEHVGYARCGAPHPTESVDALIIPHRSTADEVLAMLDGAPSVRPGGVLVFRSAAAPGDAPLESVLGRFGYHVERRYGAGRNSLYVARRVVPLAYAKAA
jgi:hypothetical protein